MGHVSTRIDGTEVEYLSCAETAKLIRVALRRAFPAVKFGVRSRTYSGGASIDVSWTDGPCQREVEAVAEIYAGGRFDGMIDLAYSVDHVLLPDGSAILAHSPGTEGNCGSHPAINGLGELAEIVAGARRVSFGADHVFCSRHLSSEALTAVNSWLEVHAHEDEQASGYQRWWFSYGSGACITGWTREDLTHAAAELLADPEARQREAERRRLEVAS